MADVDIRAHLREHHGVHMHDEAQDKTVHDLHHHDHTWSVPGHRLGEFPAPKFRDRREPPDAAAAQRAKSDRWKPR